MPPISTPAPVRTVRLPLGQSGSETGQSYTAVPRVVALIDPDGNIDSSTAIYNIFNANNPRSAYTADGTNIYVSGQGTSGDTTGGVFFTTLGSSSATAITGLDTTSKTAAKIPAKSRSITTRSMSRWIAKKEAGQIGTSSEHLVRLRRQPCITAAVARPCSPGSAIAVARQGHDHLRR
jgi:hypothetical protein